MSAEAQINSLIVKFKEIKTRADTLLEKAIVSAMIPYLQLGAQTKTLVEIYETTRYAFATVSKGQSVPALLQYDQSVADTAQLLKLSIECAASMAFLEALRSPIPTADKDRLDSLREEIASLETFDENLFKHVGGAIGEYEKAHYLASALLAGKVVVYVLEQLPGETDEDRASALVKSSLLDEKMKPNFLKGARRARVHFTHNISAVPLPQDALSVVTDACTLSITLMKLRSLGK